MMSDWGIAQNLLKLPRRTLMVDKPKTPSTAETTPGVHSGLSAIASANAPVIFFDNVANFGSYKGIAHLTLVVTRFLPGSDGKPVRDCAVAAHLRMPLPALASLKEAISGIEKLLADQQNKLGKSSFN